MADMGWKALPKPADMCENQEWAPGGLGAAIKTYVQNF